VLDVFLASLLSMALPLALFLVFLRSVGLGGAVKG